MKVIVIDPAKRICELRKMEGAKAVCDFFPNGPCIAGILENGDFVYIDDEALLTQQDYFFVMPFRPEPLAGIGLLTGPDNDEGSGTLDAATTAEALHRMIRWLTRSEVEAWVADTGRRTAVQCGDAVVTWSEMASRSRA